MVTDLAEVFRLGTAKARENLEFRRYLSAHHHREDEFHILASQVQPQIDCQACANCCRHSTVSVDQGEIAEIARHLNSTPEDVSQLYTGPDPDSPLLRTLRTTAEGCVFLDGNLCMVYEARPRACRDFPYVTVGRHSLGGRPASHARWAPYCPIIFNALELHKHSAGYHPRLRS